MEGDLGGEETEVQDLEGKGPRWKRDLEREGSPVEKGPRLKGTATVKMAQMEKKWRRKRMERGTSMERGSG